MITKTGRNKHLFKNKAKILPPHSWETHPGKHLGGVGKPFIIALITVVLLLIVSLSLLFKEEIVGKAFEIATVNTAGVENNLRVLANRPGTIIPVRANIGAATTTAIRFVMDLPLRPDGTQITCSEVNLVSVLPWGSLTGAATPLSAGLGSSPSAAFSEIADCINNQLIFEQSTLDVSLAQTNIFTIANIIFANGLLVGTYQFTANEFTIVDSSSPPFPVINIATGLSASATVVAVECNVDADCSAGQSCQANSCAVPSVCRNAPPLVEATACPGDDQNLLAPIPSATLIADQTGCTASLQCEYFCNEGYQLSSVPSVIHLVLVGGSYDPVGPGIPVVQECNGVSWRQSNPATFTPGYFQGTWASSANDIWVVGNAGRIYHYDGNGWDDQTNPALTTVALFAVEGSSPNNVWAVGDGGIVLRYDGAQWITISGAPSIPLDGVWTASPTNTWIVGESRVVGENTVLQWDGTALNTISGIPGIYHDFNSVWGIGNEVWITGSKSVVSGVGQGVIYHYDGNALAQEYEQPLGLTTSLINSVWGSSATDLWAVGNVYSTSGVASLLLRNIGSGWNVVSSPMANGLSEVWGTAANGVYIMGPDGVQHWDGASWTDITPPSPMLRNGRGFAGYSTIQSACTPLVPPLPQLYTCSNALTVGGVETNQVLTGPGMVDSAGQPVSILAADQGFNPSQSAILTLSRPSGTVAQLSESCDTAGNLVEYYCTAANGQYLSDTAAQQALAASQTVQCGTNYQCINGACLARELCTDGIDNDNDGLTDCADSDCVGDASCIPPTCGNGILDASETCDASVTPPNIQFANNADCQSQNFVGGTLGCSSTCTLDVSQCRQCNVDADCPTGQQCSNNQCATPVVSSLSCIPYPTGLVAAWEADGNANDVLNTNDGILQNGVTYVPGQIGQAFHFDAAQDQYVSVNSPSSNLNLQRFTIEMWVYPEASGRYQALVATPPAPFSYFLSLNQLRPAVYFGGSGFGWIEPVDPFLILPLNQWNHLAISYNGRVNFYVNGIEYFAGITSAPNINSLSGPLQIGGRLDNNEDFTGSIDELAIYNRVLTATEIQAIYNAGSAGKCECAVDADCPVGQQCSSNQCTAVQTQALPSVAPSAPSSSSGGYICNSRWSCSTWSYCNKELKQTRTCVDLDRCEQKPKNETQACSPCDESWVCSEWNSCSSGTQTRSCADEHGCGTVRTKPITQQACSTGGRIAAPPVIRIPAPVTLTFWDKYKLPILAGGAALILTIPLLFFLTKLRKKKAYNINDLANWIKAELNMGTSVQDVKQILKDQTGWASREVESAFQKLQPPQT